VLDSSSHFVGLLSTDGTLLDANNSALRFASVQLKDVIGRKFWDTVWWEHSPELQELLRTQLEIAARGDVVRFEATHRSAEGSLRVIDFSLSPIKDAEGRVVSVIPEGRDITEIVETQRALVESRLKYFTLFNAASDAIFILRSGVFIDCNASTLTLFGVTRDQIIGKSPWEFSPRFQLDGRFSEEKAREYIEASLEGETQTFEWLHARYDGATFIAEVRLTRLDLEDDNRSLFAIVRDITARRHAEDALKESEERYRDLVEHLPIGVVVATDEHIVYVNSAAVHLLGLPSRDQGVGRSVYDFVPRENWEATRDRRSRVIRTAGRSDSAEAKIVRLDRTLVDIASVVTQIKYNGKPSILNLLTDITERKQADEALRQSEEKFSKAFQTSPAPMSILTLRDLRFVDVSRAFLEKMGYSRDEVIGRSLEELGLFEKEAEREAIAKILAEEGEVRDFESAFRMKGGEVRHGITSATVFLLKGEPCVLSVVVDVTERRRAELALRHSMQQLHDLAERLELIREEERKAISREVHDELGQLLTALKLDLFALKKGGLIADSAEAIANVDSMLTLIGSAITAVQDISRKLRPGILDNLGLVAAVQWQAEEFQKRSAIECRLSLPKGELVLDDRRSTTLFRILQEALTNVARHAQARKVDITLSATPEEGILVVADDGIGIDDQIINDPKSIGLLGIRERLHPLGGVCIIRRRATGGTEVLVRLPLKDIIIHRAP
jgi:PAS domain S-box-containing protein